MEDTMNIQRTFSTGLVRTTVVLLGVMASTLFVVSAARAEALSRHQPQALIQAERALEQGQPERALSLLHRQRAILRHSKFRSQGEALACQAHIQMQDFQKATRVCDEVVAYNGDGSIAETYGPSDD
jgi:hypothetical protein